MRLESLSHVYAVAGLGSVDLRTPEHIMNLPDLKRFGVTESTKAIETLTVLRC